MHLGRGVFCVPDVRADYAVRGGVKVVLIMTTCYEVRRMHDYDRTDDVYRSDDLVCRCESMPLAIFNLGRMSAQGGLFIRGGVDFDAGRTKFGHEFITNKDRPEYWYVKEA